MQQVHLLLLYTHNQQSIAEETTRNKYFNNRLHSSDSYEVTRSHFDFPHYDVFKGVFRLICCLSLPLTLSHCLSLWLSLLTSAVLSFCDNLLLESGNIPRIDEADDATASSDL